eukprot:jgi/Psemu1/51641/gm1.51641_g
MAGSAEQKSSPTLPENTQLQLQTPAAMSILQMFTRAMSDCFDEEMVQLNKDRKEDAFFSGIRNFIAAECVEFREDAEDDYRAENGNRCRGTGEGQPVSRARVRANTHDTSYMTNNLETSKSVAERTEDDDDERSDFLFARMNDGLFAVPTVIVYKPKKKGKREEYDYPEPESIDADFFFTCNKCSWKGKGKGKGKKQNQTTVGDASRHSKRKRTLRWRKKGFLPFLTMTNQ